MTLDLCLKRLSSSVEWNIFCTSELNKSHVCYRLTLHQCSLWPKIMNSSLLTLWETYQKYQNWNRCHPAPVFSLTQDCDWLFHYILRDIFRLWTITQVWEQQTVLSVYLWEFWKLWAVTQDLGRYLCFCNAFSWGMKAAVIHEPFSMKEYISSILSQHPGINSRSKIYMAWKITEKIFRNQATVSRLPVFWIGWKWRIWRRLCNIPWMISWTILKMSLERYSLGATMMILNHDIYQTSKGLLETSVWVGG